jgi:hypothetical protein
VTLATKRSEFETASLLGSAVEAPIYFIVRQHLGQTMTI